MRNIFITEKQFKHIVNALSKSCVFFDIKPEDINCFCVWYDESMTGLPFPIGVVDGILGVDEKDLFPYLYFICNGELGKITVSYSPKYVGAVRFKGEKDRILKQFIINNVETLYLVAHDFFTDNQALRQLNFETMLPELLNESPKLRTNATGLKTDIWVDQAQTYKNGGHWKRIKFKDGSSKKSSDFASMTIGDEPEIIGKTFGGGIKSADIEQLREFVKLNKQLLLDLSDGIINYYIDFVPNIYTFRGKTKVYHGPKEDRSYELTNSEAYGFVVVKSNDGLFNYFDKNNGGIVSRYWFDVAMPFDKHGEFISAKAEINSYWYNVATNGKLTYIG